MRRKVNISTLMVFRNQRRRTFKCCPKLFTQLYTIHGFKNRHYLQLVYCLLPNKSEQCYLTMIDLLKGCISEQGLSFQPEKINLNFEISAHSAFRASFPNATLLCCRFIQDKLGTGIFKSQDWTPILRQENSQVIFSD